MQYVFHIIFIQSMQINLTPSPSNNSTLDLTLLQPILMGSQFFQDKFDLSTFTEASTFNSLSLQNLLAIESPLMTPRNKQECEKYLNGELKKSGCLKLSNILEEKGMQEYRFLFKILRSVQGNKKNRSTSSNYKKLFHVDYQPSKTGQLQRKRAISQETSNLLHVKPAKKIRHIFNNFMSHSIDSKANKMSSSYRIETKYREEPILSEYHEDEKNSMRMSPLGESEEVHTEGHLSKYFNEIQIISEKQEIVSESSQSHFRQRRYTKIGYRNINQCTLKLKPLFLK